MTGPVVLALALLTARGQAVESVGGGPRLDRCPPASSHGVTGRVDSIRVPLLAGEVVVSDVPGRLSSGSSLAPRGQGHACQRSLRNRPRSRSWLLQSSLPGGEGVWRPVIDLSHLNEFVHLTRFKMETVASVLLSVREGFSSFPGSKRCVLSDPDPSIFEEAIEVHVGGDGLPVPSPVFRTVDRSPGLHQGLRSHVSVGTLPRDQTSPLSGRLVASRFFRAGSQAVHPVAPLALSYPRDCDK